MVIACLNINSLAAHIDELRIFINNTKIDILCINETKLDQTISDHEVCLPGFDIIRKDRRVNGRQGGGVCIYVRANLNFKIRNDLQSEILENLIVEIIKPQSKSILVSTWYRPPDSPVSYFTEFEKMVGLLDTENLEYFVLGDLNVDFKQLAKSSCRDKLDEIFDIYGIHQLINESTRITDTSSSLIDLCLTNSISTVVDSGVIHLSISDHSLIYMVRKAHYVRSRARTIKIRTLKNFSSEDFQRDLNQQPWANVYHSRCPNDMWRIWKELLMGVIDKHAPVRSRRISNKSSPWVTNELKRLMYKRDYLKKQAISSGDPSIWCQYRQVRNHTNNEIKKAKRLYFTKNLDLHKDDIKKTWKLINELNSRNRKKTNNISEIKMGEEVITSPMEMAETFNSYFTNVGVNLAAKIPPPKFTPESYLTPTDKIFSIQIPTITTVCRLFKAIDENKSVGLDNIPNKLLKMAADVVVPSLTEIFSQSINTGIFPNDWKEARMSPLFKNGVKSDPNNYRPISIIPAVSKIFEKIIFDQLYAYLNDNNLLSQCQSGFRSLYSTLTALLEATNDWCVNVDNGLLNGVVFIDLKKAFDTIDHGILLQNLECYGVDTAGIRWFESYLFGRTQKCAVNGTFKFCSSYLWCSARKQLGTAIIPCLH